LRKGAIHPHIFACGRGLAAANGPGMTMSRGMMKMIGWLLLAGTIGVVSCQALLTSGRDDAGVRPPVIEAPAASGPARPGE
jgi:hypothetical protein